MIPVSLGIPMFRSERFLPGLFAVLSRLEPKPAEIILLDDASPDRSYDVAVAFAEDSQGLVRVLRNETNSGIAATYNRLASAARHPWVHILDADDQPVEVDYYARILPRLKDDVAAVVSAIDSNSLALRAGNAVLGRLVPSYPPECWPLLGSFATRSGVIYQRERLLAHPFPEPAFPGSDIVHLLSLRRHGRIAFEKSAHLFYNVHPQAASSQQRDFTRYEQALQRFGLLTRFTHKADLAVRRLGQTLDRS